MNYEGLFSIAQTATNGSLPLACALTFAAGFLTALSPCVYPLIPITLSVMGARHYSSRAQGFTVAACYVLGMALLYTVLGIVFASFGWVFGCLLQSKIVSVCIAIVFVLLALSLFGLFNLRLPQSWHAKLHLVGNRGGNIGAFLMGLVAGLVAAPCTGPVLAFILTLIATRGDVPRGILLMAIFSLGMGLPFLILGTFTSFMTRLPKSGQWMRVIKVIFGIATLGVACMYLQNAFGWSPSTEKAASHTQLRWQTLGAQADILARYDAIIDAARQAEQPVVVDFYADWCTACKELEHSFEDENVQAALADAVLLRIDVTHETQQTRTLQRAYQVVGLPAVTFISRKGEILPNPRIFGFVSAKELLSLLKSADLK